MHEGRRRECTLRELEKAPFLFKSVPFLQPSLKKALLNPESLFSFSHEPLVRQEGLCFLLLPIAINFEDVYRV